MSQNIRIEKDVPMPNQTALPPLPLEKMEVGDSFTMKLTGEREKSTIRQRLTRFQTSNPPLRFSMRTVAPDQIRIFRVEDRKDT